MHEDLKCAFCGAEWASDQDGCTNWGAMDVGGRRFYFCPKERPPDGAPAEEFKAAKARMQARALELLAAEPEWTCQVCGCTESTPCPQGCEWISPGVLCSGCFDRVPMPGTPEELAVVMAPLLNSGFSLELNGIDGFRVLAALQLVCRHPELSGEMRVFIEEFGRRLQAGISLTPQIAKLCEAGWMGALDVKPSLILPAGYRR